MSDLIRIQEPSLMFGYGQSADDPKRGLSAFGPVDLHEGTHPGHMRFAVIGTTHGIQLFSRFSKLITRPVLNEENHKKPLLWPFFPGFEAVFHSVWPDSPAAVRELSVDRLDKAIETSDLQERVNSVVDIYMEAIRSLSKEDSSFDFVVCLVPDFLYKHCRPESAGARRIRPVDPTQGDLFTELAEAKANDFRRQLKAQAMGCRSALQIIRESTLAVGDEEKDEVMRKWKRGMTPLSDRAWNICTTMFYKAGGKPWKLAGARDGVCYIGLAFRKPSVGSKSSACCAAQMFLKDGDGVVFKGEEGVWWSPEERLFHLEAKSAEKMLKGVLETYNSMGGKPLQEVFLHCPSTLTQDEYEGFKAACPQGAKLNVIQVRQDPRIKLLRQGDWPICRGTFWKLADTEGLLYGSGFKESLRTYDGSEIPVPLRIRTLFGESTIEQVASDILGLTKLNYNTCKLGENAPVTVGFSDAVGEILVSNPGTSALPNFKYYI